MGSEAGGLVRALDRRGVQEVQEAWSIVSGIGDQAVARVGSHPEPGGLHRERMVRTGHAPPAVSKRATDMPCRSNHALNPTGDSALARGRSFGQGPAG